jgi:NAD(P)-dependent dehydrogenase (short-subunit alcohol dehydrogenase family)
VELSLRGKKAVVTGGGGAICGEVSRALAREGASVAIWDLSMEAAGRVLAGLPKDGARALAVGCDVLERASVQAALRKTLDELGTVDILINGAGGSRREATTSAELAFFDIPADALCNTLHLNYMSAVIPSQEVGRVFAQKRQGVILNIASIAGLRPLTRSVAYSNGKAAVISFTQWLAVHMAREYSPAIRVNAVAPGFVLTDQNRFLLEEAESGRPTERGRQILTSVPMGRLGAPEEISGAVLYLVSDQARFVTGAVLAVDGGFSASAGV